MVVLLCVGLLICLNPTSSDKNLTPVYTLAATIVSLNPTSSDKKADLAYSNSQRATVFNLKYTRQQRWGQVQRQKYKLFMKL